MQVKDGKKVDGRSNPSLETRQKISRANKGKTAWNKGIKRWWKSPTQFTNGQNAGAKHPMWKGGISKVDRTIRRMKEYLQWRTSVFERDNWTCQTCRHRGYVTVHHIKSFGELLKAHNVKTVADARKVSELWDINNGVTLCEECHSLTDNYKGRGRLR
jgi:hypothetical protein